MTGGVENWQTYLDSTEIFVPALFQSSWTDVGKLPSPRVYLAAISLNNNVFVMGNYELKKFYQYNKPTWNPHQGPLWVRTPKYL